MKAIQQSRDADNLEQWKAARDSGSIKTATSGLKRDADSSRMGSAGLFAERRREDAVHRPGLRPGDDQYDGIPIKKKQESARRGLIRSPGSEPLREGGTRAGAAPAPAPAAPELPNPFAAFFDKPKAPERSRARARGIDPFEAARVTCSAATK